MRYYFILFLLALVLTPGYGSASDALLQKNKQVHSLNIDDLGSTPMVVDGRDVSESEFTSFTLVIITPNGSLGSGVCGGTLIAANKVVTAATCITSFDSDSLIQVIPGYRSRSDASLAENRVGVIDYAIHPDFRDPSLDFIGRNLENDIAVLTLETRVSGPYARVFSGPDELVDADATGVGAGLLDPDIIELAPVLQKFDTRIESNEACQDELGFVIFFEDGTTANEVVSSMLCLKLFSTPSGPCLGDGGGPLFANIRGRSALVGVLSTIDNEDCDGLNTIAIYSRMSSFTSFVKRESPETRFISSEFSPAPPMMGGIHLLLLQDP